MLPMWRLMDALLGGTETMRNAGKEYLTQHTGEVEDRYRERLAQSTLWNQLEITLGGWVGRPFRDPLKLNDDVPEEITKLSDDIDQLGTNMDTFARAWFRCGVSKAFCHVLIEAPPVQENEDGSTLNKEQAAEQNLRPYWCLIEPDEIIAARSEVIDGQEVYTHVRIHERTLEKDPDDEFAEVWVEKIRVYDRLGDTVTVTVYRRDNDKDADSADGWPQETKVNLGIKVIPLITFYADRQGFLLGKSPLQDLAELNKKHYNSQSDQDNILTIARFPILAASGVTSIDGSDALSADPQAGSDFNGTKGVVIGPWNVLVSEEVGSKFYYVEHSGKAIKTGQDSLELLEAKMAAYGSEFLKKSPDRQTATARAMDSQESVSPLQAITLNFIDAMQSALALTAMWMNISSNSGDVDEKFHGGTVTIVTDFGPEDASGVDLAALTSMQQARIISGKQMRREAKRRGILADDFDEKDNQRELDEELLRLPAPGKDLDPLVTVGDALKGKGDIIKNEPKENEPKENEDKKEKEKDDSTTK